MKVALASAAAAAAAALCAPTAASAAGVVLDVLRAVGEPDPDVPLVVVASDPTPGMAADLEDAAVFG